MYLHGADRFLTQGSTQLPQGKFRAVGIHPSSEVDLAMVGNYLLGVKSLVPYQASMQVTAVRAARANDSTFVPRDGQTLVGEKLVLVLYGEEDELVPPGPRLPTIRTASINNFQVGAATLVMRLPFQGRRHATFFAQQYGGAFDCNFVIRGIKYVGRDQAADLNFAGKPFTDEVTDTLFGGAAAQPVSTVNAGAEILCRTMHVGGGADLQEAFDELEFWATTLGNNNTATLQLLGEAFGERLD